jgi:hypothetical protein
MERQPSLDISVWLDYRLVANEAYTSICVFYRSECVHQRLWQYFSSLRGWGDRNVCKMKNNWFGGKTTYIMNTCSWLNVT